VCKSRDAKVLCGADGCIDQIIAKIAPQLPKDYPCELSTSYMADCIQPFIAPMSQAGANLMALMTCDQAAATVRNAGKVACKATAAAAPAAAEKKADVKTKE
jgi:hypothetical protein